MRNSKQTTKKHIINIASMKSYANAHTPVTFTG
ncbi:hypothetical protein DJ55_3594 [Yersinia pseudotuberculosis]|nr:hypothetical protein DJ55_3594 [Yersinia pseudotuberculosis]